MANFSTHLTVAAAGAGLLSTLCLKVGYVDVADALLMTVAGTTGGILPDIDLKYSYPSKILFSLFGTVTALLWMFGSNYTMSILELWMFGLILYLLIRYPLWKLFHEFAVHRGSIHSIAAALLAALTTSALCAQVFETTDLVAWLTAFSMFFGFILHLLLDEIYSVDFMNHRIKRSFGTALKIIDRRHMLGSSAIVLLCICTWFYTPGTQEFVKQVANKDAQHTLYQRLMPKWWLDRFPSR